jgi:streptomycin 6-kinase
VLKTYDYLPHEYVEVDRLSRFVALRDFFRDVRARSARDPLLHFTPTELKDAKRRFLDFVRITSPLVYLGDLTTENLVYSKTRGWIFLDVNDQHLLYTELGWSRNVFTYLHPPENLLRQINRIVLAERKGQPLDECEEALSVEDLHAIIKKRKYN